MATTTLGAGVGIGIGATMILFGGFPVLRGFSLSLSFSLISLISFSLIASLDGAFAGAGVTTTAPGAVGAVGTLPAGDAGIASTERVKGKSVMISLLSDIFAFNWNDESTGSVKVTSPDMVLKP